MENPENGSIELFTTCPPYKGQDASSYIERVREVSRWSDDCGCRGMLVYTDNSLLDPWITSQIVIQNTKALEPLVAVQPVYMHPFSVAKMVSTLSVLYGRRICLNMVAGGFKQDLTALNDVTPHDKRYDRLVEYTLVIQYLLAGSSPVTFHGEFYQIEQLRLKPPLAKDLFPHITMSGSSEAGVAAADAVGATAVKYPEPPEKCATESLPRNSRCGIRIGIIAREQDGEAWEIAEERFPPDRAGQIAHSLAMKVSDSAWHHRLSTVAQDTHGDSGTYWLVPFQNYKTFCPYLVGSYEKVAEDLSRYLSIGYSTFILDVPASEEELMHTNVAFVQAQQIVRQMVRT